MQNSVNKSERNSLLKYVSVRHTRLKYFKYSAKSAICSFGDRPPTVQFKNLTHQLFPCTLSPSTGLSALLNYTARMECLVLAMSVVIRKYAACFLSEMAAICGVPCRRLCDRHGDACPHRAWRRHREGSSASGGCYPVPCCCCFVWMMGPTKLSAPAVCSGCFIIIFGCWFCPFLFRFSP